MPVRSRDEKRMFGFIVSCNAPTLALAFLGASQQNEVKVVDAGLVQICADNA